MQFHVIERKVWRWRRMQQKKKAPTLQNTFGFGRCFSYAIACMENRCAICLPFVHICVISIEGLYFVKFCLYYPWLFWICIICSLLSTDVIALFWLEWITWIAMHNETHTQCSRWIIVFSLFLLHFIWHLISAVYLSYSERGIRAVESNGKKLLLFQLKYDKNVVKCCINGSPWLHSIYTLCLCRTHMIFPHVPTWTVSVVNVSKQFISNFHLPRWKSIFFLNVAMHYQCPKFTEKVTRIDRFCVFVSDT